MPCGGYRARSEYVYTSRHPCTVHFYDTVRLRRNVGAHVILVSAPFRRHWNAAFLVSSEGWRSVAWGD